MKKGMASWGVNYIFKDGEIVKARGNEADTKGAVARYFRRAENGMPTLEGKGPFYVEVIGNKEEISSAVRAIEKINENEAEIIANCLEGLLDRNKAEITGKSHIFENITNIPECVVYLDENGKKISGADGSVAVYSSANGKVSIEINKSLEESYDFGLVSSCIKGLKERQKNIIQLKEVSSKLKEYMD